MKRLVEYALENGGSIIIEVDEPVPDGVTRAGRGDVVEKATQKFEEALQRVKPATLAIISTLRELSDSPDEASVGFGVKLSAKAGVVIASADADLVARTHPERRETMPKKTSKTSSGLKEKTMRGLLATLLICLIAPAALAQDNPPTPASASQENPLSAHIRREYRAYKNILLRSADKMPEENYNFKPTDTVRSFGQIVAHVAESQYFYCSAVLGEKSTAPKVEQTKPSKADLIAALKDAFAYCDKAYDGMTDASATEMVKFMGSDTPKLGVLHANMIHTLDHYGNLVTYMRIKGIVPPTSEKRQ